MIHPDFNAPYVNFVSIEEFQLKLRNAVGNTDKLTVKPLLVRKDDSQGVKIFLFRNGVEVTSSSNIHPLLVWLKFEYGARWMIENGMMITE